MSTMESMIDVLQFCRGRTMGLLDEVESHEQSSELLAWRPGDGRAHLAWQFMHIGITDEVFATERLNPEKDRAFEELWPRFRGGSTPDDEIPSFELIRQVLDEGRQHLLQTLASFDESQLGEIVFRGKNNTPFTLLQTTHLIAWHEAHHHGQAHITRNLFDAQTEG